MAQYKRETLENYADGLVARAWLMFIPYAMVFGAVVFFFHTLQWEFFGFLEVVSFGKVKYPAIHQQWDGGIMFPALFFGALYGFFKGKKYKIQAQIVMCQAEQERHLKHLAEVFTWQAIQTPPTTGPR